MNLPDDDRAPMAKALDWATRISSTSILMVLPALLGYFVDQRLGTVILFTFLGLVLGMVVSIRQLIKLVATPQPGGERGTGELDSDRQLPTSQPPSGGGFLDPNSNKPDSNETS